METKHVNRTYLIGNLGADPEVKTFGTGTKKTVLRLAVSNDYKLDDGTWKKMDPTWIDCECWGDAANDAEANLKKGSRIALSGNLKLEQWEDKTTGAKRSKHIVKVYEFEIQEKREGNGGGGGDVQAATSQPSSGGEIPF